MMMVQEEGVDVESRRFKKDRQSVCALEPPAEFVRLVRLLCVTVYTVWGKETGNAWTEAGAKLEQLCPAQLASIRQGEFREREALNVYCMCVSVCVAATHNSSTAVALRKCLCTGHGPKMAG